MCAHKIQQCVPNWLKNTKPEVKKKKNWMRTNW